VCNSHAIKRIFIFIQREEIMNQYTVDEALKTIRRMLKDSEYSFFISHGPGGNIHARLMQHFEPEPDLTLWFGAGPSSRKVSEVKANGQVTVSAAHPQHGGYVSMIGTAEVVNDPGMKSKHWRAHWSDIYPGGPDNDAYVLIKFTPKTAELMDFADQDLPAPYGLKPFGLEKKGDTWALIADRSAL